MLTIRDISKSFGPVQALRSVCLEVQPDELMVVLGPTGAGKTTLLRTLAGLEAPDSGQILMDGADITFQPPAARDVALVFQNFSLYPHWTVRRNMEFPLRAPGRRMAEADIRRRVEWAASVLRITHLLDRPATHLSGGEMQRVAIGRAIVRTPRLFLMDEPLTNLDAKLREALRVELVQLRRDLRRPMIFVTHDQAEALSMGDRIAVLVEGRILQVGTPQEIYRNPSSPLVARLLGQPTINLIRLVDGRTEAGVEVLPGVTGTIGIRPEDLAVSGGPHAATVRVVQEMGPTRTLLVRWAGCDLHIVVPKSVPVKVGDTIYPRFDPSRAVVWG